MRDNIHHSSLGALEYGERTAQAIAYVEKYGEWEPLWITNVAYSGAICTITTNRPRQCVGDLVVDTTKLSAAASHGFSLWNVTGNVALTITGVSVSGNTIVLTTGSTISGDTELGYAVRGPAVRADGTVAVPEHAATWGNIAMRGKDAPPFARNYETLDQFLCSHRKITTV